MCLAGAGIEHHGLGRVGGDTLEGQPVPGTFARPTPEAAVERCRFTELSRQVLAGDTVAWHLGHGLDEPPQGDGSGLPYVGDDGKLGVKRRPGGVAQTMAEHSRRVSGWGANP